MSYTVLLTRDAEQDLQELFDFVLERELHRPGGGDLDLAQDALDAIRASFALLQHSPFSCRKTALPGHGSNPANLATAPFLRELVIPFGHTGYVALFDIRDSATVVIAAVRHQREDDYR